MRRIICIITLLPLFMACRLCPPIQSAIHERLGLGSIEWPSNVITIAFSTSLNSPPPNIRPAVTLSVRRGVLSRDGQKRAITFIETTSNETASRERRRQLITVGAGNSFSTTEQPARARTVVQYRTPARLATGRGDQFGALRRRRGGPVSPRRQSGHV